MAGLRPLSTLRKAGQSALQYNRRITDQPGVRVMPEYLRYRVAGGTYFFTVNLFDRQSDLLLRHIDVLRQAVRLTRQKRPFHIDAWVVLPEHLHCLWTLPAGDDDFPRRWQEIKKAFSRALPASERRSDTQLARHERGIWQRRYWEHFIRDEEDYAAHLDYVHVNPLRHGLVSRVVDWPYSTFHHWMKKGVYSADWGSNVSISVNGGEPWNSTSFSVSARPPP